MLRTNVERNLWSEKRRDSLVTMVRCSMAIICVAYPIQLFAVEISANANFLNYFIFHRIGMSAFALLLFLATFSRKFVESRFFLPVVLLTGVALGVFQAGNCAFEARVPLISAFFLPLIFVIVLSFSVPASLSYFSLILFAELPFLMMAFDLRPEGARESVGWFLLSNLLLATSRSSAYHGVKNFLNHHKIRLQQEKIISLQREMTDQISGFLPKEIYRRILKKTTNERFSIIEATESVIRLRKKDICCIFSDIRKFSKKSMDIDNFLRDDAIPNIKSLTSICDDEGGVTRLIGDLILVYFDNPEKSVSTIMALDCAIKMFRHNEESKSNIERNLILTSGDSMVGNIGGNHHAREITCLGPPVNLAARIDEFMKNNPEYQNDHIVLSPMTFKNLIATIPEFSKYIQCKKIGVGK